MAHQSSVTVFDQMLSGLLLSIQEPSSTWNAPRSPSVASRRYSTRPSEPCSVLPRSRRGVRGAPCSERGNIGANTTLHHHKQQQPLLLQEDERKKKTSASECVLLRLLTFYNCFFSFFKAILEKIPIFYLSFLLLPLLERFAGSLKDIDGPPAPY